MLDPVYTFILFPIKQISILFTFQTDGYIRAKDNHFIYYIGLKAPKNNKDSFTWASGTDSSLDVSPESSLWNERSKRDAQNYETCGSVIVYASQFWYVVDTRSWGVGCTYEASFVCERRGKDCTKAGWTGEAGGAGGKGGAGGAKKGKGKGKGNKGGRRRGGFFKRAWKWGWKKLRG